MTHGSKIFNFLLFKIEKMFIGKIWIRIDLRSEIQKKIHI